jgi:Protein of unknown function (DUF418)
MALSNYLFQSLVCTTLFYSYGLGLYGSVHPAAGLALSFAIYSVQVPLSTVVVMSLPLRSDGMVLEVPNVWKTAADVPVIQDRGLAVAKEVARILW